MEIFYETLSPKYHRAVVEAHGLVVYWRGACLGCYTPVSTRKDFWNTYQLFLYAMWAFCEVHMPDNGKSIVEAIQVGTCEVVSDRSFKEGMGTAAWILQNPLSLISLTGKTKIAEEVKDKSTYRSELGGIFSLVLMIQHICQYYKIKMGHVSIACNGLGPLLQGPLLQCFAKFKEPNPQAPHFDMISSIQKLILRIPVSWHWHHVAGHQDASSGILNNWATS